ncbi:MAG: HlyD family secretion protein [Pseudomonadales bacterium]|nr:HlyD family secretion protein [Pseudomonadales bacterium]
MLEVILCSLITVLPDFLYRKYRYGMSWGKEITFFTMWYELRWGISACAILTISLVTLVFFYHPSTTHATPIFRTMTILPEQGGRVQHVFVKNNQQVTTGTALFSMYDQSQTAVIDSAEVQILEVEAEFATANAQLEAAKSGVARAHGAYLRSKHEYDRKMKLQQQGQHLISASEVQKLGDTVGVHKAEVNAAKADESAALAMIETILPAKKASAVEVLNSAKVEGGKRTVYANIDGQLKQFTLQPGDYVNPILRPAGILVPSDGEASGREGVQAGFSQLAADVIKVGMFAEITCLSKPFTIIPMKVARVQDIIASGQIRPNEALLDLQDRAKPGTLTVLLKPLYEGGLDGVVPGTKCIANAYSYHHELIESGELGTGHALYLHMVDAVGFVHAIILRIQALLLPVKILVFSGH